jgi:WD40 repeat protein
MSTRPGGAEREALTRLLNEARQRLHLSVQAAANLAGVPKATAQGWLSGKHLPTPALRGNFHHLIHGLGLDDVIDPDWWIDHRWDRMPAQPRSQNPPYVGLRPFTAEDRNLFFGRAPALAALAAAVDQATGLADRKIVVLFGSSGSGKSSLLAAGLCVATQDGGALSGRHVKTITVAALVDQTTTTATPFTEADVVVIDQFEDVFHLAETERRQVFKAVSELADRATVVIGLRADAFAPASLEPLLADALAHPVLLVPLSTAELRQAIVEPAQSRNVVVEDDLIAVLLSDLGVTSETQRIAPGVLPLVSTALLSTWVAGSGVRMTLRDYRHVGGVGSAVEHLAEGVFGALSDGGQQLAEKVFLRLVTVESDSVSRATLPLATLDEPAGEVIAAFADARLLTVSQADVQISHEALLRHWPRLSEWIESSREDLLVLQQLRRAAQLWIDGGRDPGALIPLKRLPAFESFVADGAESLLTADEREFVDASAAHFASVLDNERRANTRLRRRGRLAGGLAAVAVALALIAGVMYAQSRTAQHAAEAAVASARSRQVALAAQQAASQDPNLQLRLSLVADSLATTVEGRSALGDATSVYAPLRWAGSGPAVLALSPDRTVVARADGTGGVTLWRGADALTTPGIAFQADPSQQPLVAAAITAVDARLLLAVAGDNNASIWDITDTPRQLATLDGDQWSAVAFSPSGRMAAFGDRTGAVRLLDLANLEAPTAIATLHLPRDLAEELLAVRSLLFSRQGDTLYVGGKAHAIYRWRIAAGKQSALDPIRYTSERPALSLAISPLGDRLVAGLMTRRILQWRLKGARAEPLPEITGFLSNVNDVTFNPDGTKLFAAGDDHGTYTFDVASGVQEQRLSGPSAVDSVGQTSDGRIVTADSHGDLRVWPLFDPVLRADGSSGYCFSTDPSGHWLALATANDGILLWDTTGGGFAQKAAPAVSFGKPKASSAETVAAGVGVDPLGRYLLAGTTEGSVISWPLSESGAGAATVKSVIPSQYIGFIAINPRGNLAAAVPVNDGSEIALLRVDEHGAFTKIASLPTRNPQSASFSPDGQLLAIPRTTNAVEIWSVADPAAPKLLNTLQLGAQPVIVSFSPVARMLAAGLMSGEVVVIDLTDPANPKQASSYGDARAEVYGLTWSPDGSVLLGAGGDEHVWQWDTTVPDTPAVASYSSGLGRTNDVVFVHGGRDFVATGDSGGVRAWVAGSGDARQHGCELQGSPLSDAEWSRYLVGITKADPCAVR